MDLYLGSMHSLCVSVFYVSLLIDDSNNTATSIVSKSLETRNGDAKDTSYLVNSLSFGSVKPVLDG